MSFCKHFIVELVEDGSNVIRKNTSNVFCEICAIKIAEKGNYCTSCSTTTKKTFTWWNKISLPKIPPVVIHPIGQVAQQKLQNFHFQNE